MKKWNTVFLLGFCFLQCDGREPITPRQGTLPFLAYFASRYRGLCVGTLVSRAAVLTAAVCVVNPNVEIIDRRSINVVLGTDYRHPRRGIRVQVTKLLIPNLGDSPNRGYLLEKSVSLLLLKRKVPDILAETPTRGIAIDYLGEPPLTLQEECVLAGWHFFYKGDTIYPVYKFRLQRHVRVQFMNIAKQNLWCEALAIKLRKGLSNLGFHEAIEPNEIVCVRDTTVHFQTFGLSLPTRYLPLCKIPHLSGGPLKYGPCKALPRLPRSVCTSLGDRLSVEFAQWEPYKKAQPCHGMYGAPLICSGRVVGVMTAPDAQWTNCTGHSNMIHLLASQFLRPFMTCIKKLYDPEYVMDWHVWKDLLYDDIEDISYDYVPHIYDKLFNDGGSSQTTTSEEQK